MVTVDRLRDCEPRAGWWYDQYCHLRSSSDNLLELHGFAIRLGLKVEWFQCCRGVHPHYDLTAEKRKLAVRLGAVEV
jgi:hypothetical protein